MAATVSKPRLRPRPHPVLKPLLPGLLAAALTAPLTVLPALAPRPGEPVAIPLLPFLGREAVLAAVLDAGGRVIDVRPGLVVAGGEPGFTAALWRAGIVHAVNAGDVSCFRR